MTLSRRRFLAGLAAATVASPAIVRAESIYIPAPKRIVLEWPWVGDPRGAVWVPAGAYEITGPFRVPPHCTDVQIIDAAFNVRAGGSWCLDFGSRSGLVSNVVVRTDEPAGVQHRPISALWGCA